jgi:hypothetical protein
LPHGISNLRIRHVVDHLLAGEPPVSSAYIGSPHGGLELTAWLTVLPGVFMCQTG